MPQPELLSILPVGHVLQTMMAEHQIILGFLDELDRQQAKIEAQLTSDIGPSLEVVGSNGEYLLSAENHHLREEQVLFPAIEMLGIVGPPRAMAQEHELLRPAKRAIVYLAGPEGQHDSSGFIEDLVAKISYLTSMLRSHIAKEDQVLYPMAYQAIQNSSEWEQMKRACDAIGYCPFTPGL